MEKRQALSLVSRFCRAAELDLPKKDREKIATYLQLQDKNKNANQTTLVAEDSDVIKELKKLVS